MGFGVVKQRDTTENSAVSLNLFCDDKHHDTRTSYIRRDRAAVGHEVTVTYQCGEGI